MTAPLPDCRCCGGPTTPAFAVGDLNHAISDEEFRYARCERCGAYALVDVPEDLGRFYQPAYYDAMDTALEEAGARFARGQLATFRDLVAGPHIVEVGPAEGALLRQAAREGLTDQAAVERDARCCERLRADGVRAVETDDPVAGLAELGPADAVVSFHCIEHVPDPMGLLDAAAAQVKPGGVLVLATPNPGALSFRVCGKRWLHVDAPRHLHLLPLSLLTARAEAAGLERVRVLTSDPFGRVCDDAAWPRWARHVGGERGEAFVTNVARRLARPVERRGQRGSTYTAVFRAPV